MAEYFYAFMDCQLWDQPLQRCTTFFYTFLIGTVPLLNYRYPFNRAFSLVPFLYIVILYFFLLLALWTRTFLVKNIKAGASHLSLACGLILLWPAISSTFRFYIQPC